MVIGVPMFPVKPHPYVGDESVRSPTLRKLVAFLRSLCRYTSYVVSNLDSFSAFTASFDVVLKPLEQSKLSSDKPNSAATDFERSQVKQNGLYHSVMK